MATQTRKVNSFIRGYHDYVDIWTPEEGQEYLLKRERSNKKDSNAVAVVKHRSRARGSRRSTRHTPYDHSNELNNQYQIIGDAPRLKALWLTKFLKRATNSARVVVTEKRINRGGGYGLEVPGEFLFQGDEFSINWLQSKLKK